MTPEQIAHECYQSLLADYNDESPQAGLCCGRDAIEAVFAKAIRRAIIVERNACRNVAMNWEQPYQEEEDVPAAIAKAIRDRPKP